MVQRKLNNSKKVAPDKLRILGFFLLALWILTFFEEFPYFGSFNFLWLCKISFFLLGMAALTKDSRYALVFFSICIIPEIIWTADFILQTVGRHLIGSTSFMFEYGQNKFQFAINLFHILLLPVAFFISRKLKFDKPVKKQILISGFLVLIASYYLSGLNVDINCSHNLCYPTPLDLGNVAMIIVSLYLLTCAFVIEPLIRKNIHKISENKMRLIVIALLVIAAIGVVGGIVKYSESPHYECTSNDYIRCDRFFMDRVRNEPFLSFSVIEDQSNCMIEWMVDDKLIGKYALGPKGEQAPIYLPNFKEGIRTVSSKIICN